MPRTKKYPEGHPEEGELQYCSCSFCSTPNEEHECMCCGRVCDGETELWDHFEHNPGEGGYKGTPPSWAIYCKECHQTCPDDDCLLQNYCCFSEDCECHYPDE